MAFFGREGSKRCKRPSIPFAGRAQGIDTPNSFRAESPSMFCALIDLFHMSVKVQGVSRLLVASGLHILEKRVRAIR